jgi:hypothetical protein
MGTVFSRVLLGSFAAGLGKFGHFDSPHAFYYDDSTAIQKRDSYKARPTLYKKVALEILSQAPAWRLNMRAIIAAGSIVI